MIDPFPLNLDHTISYKNSAHSVAGTPRTVSNKTQSYSLLRREASLFHNSTWHHHLLVRRTCGQDKSANPVNGTDANYWVGWGRSAHQNVSSADGCSHSLSQELAQIPHIPTFSSGSDPDQTLLLRNCHNELEEPSYRWDDSGGRGHENR